MKPLAVYSSPAFFIFSIMLFIAWFNLGGFDKAPLFAAPYTGEYFNVCQPDDSYVEVRVWGDEYYQRVESPEGYTLIRDQARQGWICYAYLAADRSEFVSTGIVYTGETLEESLLHPPEGVSPDPSFAPATLAKHLELPGEVISEKAENVRMIFMKELDILSTSPDHGNSRLRRFRKLSGSVIGLTLLIDFPDVPSSIPRGEILNFLNQPGYNHYGCNGSVRDYFYDVSGGQIEYTNHITGFYTAIHPKGYYTDSRVPIGERARELMHESLDHLEQVIGFDFSDLSTDSLNRILALNVFYAGHVDNAWAQGLWPHQGSYHLFEADGVRSRYYQITNIGTDLNLRTFCHENGHMLFGWPDLYDYGQDSTGVGNYCLMAYGGDNDNPVPPCACLRHTAGWEQIIEIGYTPPNSNLIHIANSLTTYCYTNPGNSQEAFFIESRIREGRNVHIPAEGLMIWHRDLLGHNDHEQMTCENHYKVSLEQADGRYDLEFRRNLGEEEDLFHEGDEFGSDTIPDSDWWCNGHSGLSIRDILRIDRETHFTVGSSLELRDQVIDSGVYRANSIVAGPHVTIASGTQVTLIATNSISAFNYFTIKEDANVIFEAPLIRLSHDFIVKSGSNLTLNASDSIIIGPDFLIEDYAEVDLQAKRAIQFWPSIRVQKNGRLKASMMHDETGPDPNAPGIYNGEGSNGNGQEYMDVLITGFLDADGDGYGDPNICVQGYSVQSGYVFNKIDCNDGDPLKNPKNMIIRTVKGRFLEDFEYGRNLISTLEPSCTPFTTFDLLSDFKELGSILTIQYQDPLSDFFHPTYWFFGKVCGSNREVPPMEKDDLRVIDYVVDKVQ